MDRADPVKADTCGPEKKPMFVALSALICEPDIAATCVVASAAISVVVRLLRTLVESREICVADRMGMREVISLSLSGETSSHADGNLFSKFKDRNLRLAERGRFRVTLRQPRSCWASCKPGIARG